MPCWAMDICSFTLHTYEPFMISCFSESFTVWDMRNGGMFEKSGKWSTGYVLRRIMHVIQIACSFKTPKNIILMPCHLIRGLEI